MGDGVAEPPVTLAGLLRKLRTDAGLTQEELASAASVSTRSVSDLERGINLTARKDTARLLADALNLTGAARTEFEAVARGLTPASDHLLGSAASGAGGGVAAATRTLPRDIVSFTGREPELRDLVAATAVSGGVVGIHAIGGMAGVGKTAFAVHAAHQLAPRFPGGQIFLPLHGHTPGQRPVEPADALASLLLTAGVSVQQIPAGLEARMALWRDRLAGKQLLLVLDDAASSDQIRPLLPGTGENLVLVTSRRHLTALEDARSVSLDTLSPDEASALLIRLADRPGLGPENAAVSEITGLCGYLPLAIGMLARQLHHHPAWTAGDLAADLAAGRDRLELMTTENVSVAAAFNLSYEDLTEPQQRLFRRLGLHPGTDIDGYAAAALDNIELPTARRRLEALYDHYLLTEPARGRYRLHDLIREHAHILADRVDHDSDREQATDRLMNYFQHTGEMADKYLTRYTRPGPVVRVPEPPVVPDLPDAMRALSWARGERASLLACLDHATRAGLPVRVLGLTAAMASVFRHDGPWTDASIRHSAAVQAARHLSDRLGEANALIDLGVARRLTGDYPAAAEALQAALSIYRDLGDRLGQANALSTLGDVWRQSADYVAAAEALQAALSIHRDLGDRLGEATTLNALGDVRRLTADFAGAAEVLETALSIYRDLGDRLGQIVALNYLAGVRMQTGEYPGAADAANAALGICRDIDYRLGQGHALNNLGSVWRQTGDYADAAEALGAALSIYRDLGELIGQGNVLNNLGAVAWLSGDYPGAIAALRTALNNFRQVGNLTGQANAHLGLGIVWRLTGDYPAATDAMETALGIYRDTGSRDSEAEVLNEMGTLHSVRGDLDRAEACYRQALSLAREVESSKDQACALAGLGRGALAAGDSAGAEASLRQAWEIFRRIGAAAETADVAADLDALRSAAPTRTDTGLDVSDY
jgi:tetratricopeptide (TPR) repeat protein/transcriptional regulator with XRE-family HTH domain